jgi:hypothetical protein
MAVDKVNGHHQNYNNMRSTRRTGLPTTPNKLQASEAETFEDLQQLSNDATMHQTSAHVRTRRSTLNELTPALGEHRTRKQVLLREGLSPDLGDRYTDAVSGLALLMSCSIGHKPTHQSQNIKEETKRSIDSEGLVYGGSDNSAPVYDSYSRKQYEQMRSLHRAQMSLYMTYLQQMMHSKLLPSNCAEYSPVPQTPAKVEPRPDETSQTAVDQRGSATKRGAMHILIAHYIVNDQAKAAYPAMTGPQSLVN